LRSYILSSYSKLLLNTNRTSIITSFDSHSSIACTVRITACPHELKYLFNFINLLQALGKALGVGVIDNERLKSASGVTPVIKISTDKDQKVRENSGEKIANQNSAIGNSSAWDRNHRDALIGTQNSVPMTQREHKTEVGRVEVAAVSGGGLEGGLGGGRGGGGGGDSGPSGGSESIVKTSSLNLQSQLRNLLKCGGTAAAVNPFAPRKTPSTPQQGFYIFLSFFLLLSCIMSSYFKSYAVTTFCVM
jgi:hypothetical protein